MTEVELLSDKTVATRGFLAGIIRALGSTVAKAIQKAVAPLRERIASIETRISTVECRGAALTMLLAKGHDERNKLTELDGLIARVKALEDRPLVQYCGVWSAGNEYARGSMATHAGSVWHANKATRSKPGESDHWTLAVKHGRDAR